MDRDCQYSLTWDDHMYHVKKSLNSILRLEEFVDVTVSCEGKKLSAHKIILSACSTYFRNVLRNNPCQHPIIILRGIEYQHMASILQFMYEGEVHVPNEDLNSFLATAELLEVSGLTGDLKIKDDIHTDTEEEKRTHEKKAARKKIKKRHVTKQLFDEQVHELAKKRRPSIKDAEPSINLELLISDYSDQSDCNNEDDDVSIKRRVKPPNKEQLENIRKVLSDVSYLNRRINPRNRCPLCERKFVNMVKLRRHIPYHLGETRCNMCGKVFSRIETLLKHKVVHENDKKL